MKLSVVENKNPKNRSKKRKKITIDECYNPDRARQIAAEVLSKIMDYHRPKALVSVDPPYFNFDWLSRSYAYTLCSALENYSLERPKRISPQTLASWYCGYQTPSPNHHYMLNCSYLKSLILIWNHLFVDEKTPLSREQYDSRRNQKRLKNLKNQHKKALKKAETVVRTASLLVEKLKELKINKNSLEDLEKPMEKIVEYCSFSPEWAVNKLQDYE